MGAPSGCPTSSRSRCGTGTSTGAARPPERPTGTCSPALIFPEMLHPQHVGKDWTPTFVDYFHFAFATATAFSPTDVSAVKPWMKLMMMAEEAISLVVAILVVARAVNILK